jgi:hypothetical protein
VWLQLEEASRKKALDHDHFDLPHDWSRNYTESAVPVLDEEHH